MARSLTLARRFWLAYLALAALFGGAVGTFVVLERRPAPKPPPPWSAWKPTESEAAGRQQEIATHVETQYHLPSGKTLVDVLPRGPVSGSGPIQEVAIAKTANPTQSSDFSLIDAASTAMYILCGDGAKCSIKEGKPSTARAAVLRREALELALYTFRYMDAVRSVVIFFPPAKGKDPAYVLFFTRDDFSDELHSPLRATLPHRKAPVPGRFPSGERKIVDELTTPRVFRFAVQTEQNGARVLVLAPATG
jgi:hypothetical protein